MKTLKTKRLILRDWHVTDVNDFYAYAKNENVGPRAGWKPHESVGESEKILFSFIKEREVWAIEHKTDKKVIGSIGLHQKEQHCAELGYVLSEEYWNQGLITEAAQAVIEWYFTQPNSKSLKVYHFVENKSSKRVIEKLGFTYVKTIQSHFKRYDGTMMDSIEYILLKEETNNAKTKRNI